MYLLLPFISLLFPVSSKTIIGLVDHLTFDVATDYAKIGEFCYIIPPESRGVVDSEVVIAEDGHRLLLLKDDDEKIVLNNPSLGRYISTKKRRLEVFVNATETSKSVNAPHPSSDAGVPHIEEPVPSPHVPIPPSNVAAHVHETAFDHPTHDIEHRDAMLFGINAPGPVIINDGSQPIQSTTVCDALIEKARVTEVLKPVGKLSSYHLVLWVEPHINRHRVSLFITRCGADPYAEYRIQLKNPGSFLIKHFSCEDYGLLQLYTIAFLCGCLLLIPLRKLWLDLTNTRKENPVIDVFFLAALSFVIHLGFHLMHLFAYSFDGLGFTVLVYLGELADLVFIVSTFFLISWLLNSEPLAKQSHAVITESGNTDEDGDDQQKLIMKANKFFNTTEGASFYYSGDSWTVAIRDFFAHLLQLSSSALLAALAFSALVVVFVASIQANLGTDPLTPGWRLSNPQWNFSFTGVLVSLSTSTYFFIRFLFGVRIIREFFSSSGGATFDLNTGRQIALFCSFLYAVGLPTLALFYFPLFGLIKHGTQIVLLSLNFAVLICFGLCLTSTPSAVLDFIGARNILPGLKQENSGLVTTIGRPHSAYVASGAPLASNPLFPAPGWDRTEDDETDISKSEPELVDVTNLPTRPASVFNYSTLS